MTALRWLQSDAYHIASTCGRFTVTRLTVSPHVWYVAFRRGRTAHDSARELGHRKLPASATEDERLAAINEMRRLCEAAAANDHTHTTKGDDDGQEKTPELEKAPVHDGQLDQHAR